MSAAHTASSSNPLTPNVLVRMAIGAIVGGIVGFGFVELLIHMRVTPRQLGWSDAIALWISVVLIALGLVASLVSLNRSRLAKELEPGATLPASEEEVLNTRLQAAVLALAGIMMGTPLFAQGILAIHPRTAPIIFAGICILFALQTWLNLRLWRSSDEFARAMILTICALTFAIGQGIFFLVAAAERLGLIHSVSSWNIYSLLMALYLVVSFYLSLRKSRC